MGSMCRFIIDKRSIAGSGKSPVTAVSEARQNHNNKTGTGSGQAADNAGNIQINR